MKTPDTRTLRILSIIVYTAAALLFSAFCSFTGYSDYKKFTDKIELAVQSVAKIDVCRKKLDDAFSSAIAMEEIPSGAAAENTKLAVMEMRGAFSDAAATTQNTSDPTSADTDLVENARRAHFLARELADEIDAYSGTGQNNETAETKRMLFSSLGACSASLAQFERWILSEISVSTWPDTSLAIKWIIMTAAFIIFSVFYMLFVFRMTAGTLRRAMKTLSDGTKVLREGNLNYRFREITPDEIGQVKYDFNFMARRIEKQSAELKNANTELKNQAEQLIEAHQHKDKFLSNMSHELRTPLNSIIGFSELLGERAEKLTPEKTRSYSARILTAAEHLLALITSLLDLAKSGAGTLKAVFAEFDLSFAMRDTCEMLRPLADKKGLEVATDIQDGIKVTADSRMIKQILMNLFSNAVKYTPSGRVTVRLKQSQKDGICTLDVEDTGIGIPELEHKNIFKDFHRVDNGPDMMIEGVGIGLALSRRLAKLNNCELSFTSVYGKGSTFTLTLPCHKADATKNAQA